MAAWMRSPLALLVGPNRRDLLAAGTLTDLRKSKSRLIAVQGRKNGRTLPGLLPVLARKETNALLVSFVSVDAVLVFHSRARRENGCGSYQQSALNLCESGTTKQAEVPSRNRSCPWQKGIVMPARLTRSSGSYPRLLVAASSLLLPLVLAGCSFLASSSSTPPRTPTASTTANTSPTPADQTATASETSTPTAAPTHGATAPTATPAPAPFKVTGVAFGAWPGDHQGTCRTNTFFTASVLISAPAHNPGGIVTFTWLRSETSQIAPGSVTFAAGTTSQMVTSIWSLSANQGTGSAYWVAFKTLSPEVLSTPRITYHHTCQRLVQSISVTVSPTLGCHAVTQTFTFSATVNVSPGPSNAMLTYAWKRSDGTSGTTTTGIVPQSTTTVTLSDSWNLTAPITTGTYWEELAVTTPNGITSNQATFAIANC